MKVGAAPHAFPKQFRLLSRSDFRRVYEEGQRRSVPLCALFLRPNGLPRTRLGITVPKRLGSAVVRNRLKRRLREVFRLNRHTIPGGWDLVFNPREGVAKVPFGSLVREVVRLFPKHPPPPAVKEARPR